MTINGSDDDPEERTVFRPPLPLPPPTPPTPTAAAPVSQTSQASASASQHRHIQEGDVLNHIFKVKRFIARGGMGEVFEGININSDERVAIKVILPSLAADPNVQAMFRKEARTLTRLSHPALVQYRVLAQEPVLGVFYIVTEFVDGQNLCDVLGTIQATPDELAGITRRLAAGLQVAHSLGAIHRDISPDNVMLEGGRLDQAKVIDFGIAKDLDPGSSTIIGDGFAGKLNYVAPEQLGDFNREVGPWTDVYSLGLVILAIARRQNVDMGGTLVAAVDKRRAGPDLSPVPDNLRPVLEKMLQTNPAERAQSMAEVLDLLAGVASSAAAVGMAAAPATQPQTMPPISAKAPRHLAGSGAKGTGRSKSTLPRMAGFLAGVALLIGGLLFALSDDKPPTTAAINNTPPAATDAKSPDSVATALAALNSGLPTVDCTWLDVVNVSPAAGGISVAQRGVAGKPASAQAQVAEILSANKVIAARINFEDVSPIHVSQCGPLEAFRQVRDAGGSRLSVAQEKFEMSTLTDSGADAGKLGATAIIDVSLGGPVTGAALFGLEESGEITPILPDRRSFDLEGIEKLPDGRYRIPLNTTHKGWPGVLLLTGTAPFEPNLIGGKPGSRGADWSQKFLAFARERSWKSEMVWYKTVDQRPN